MQTVKIDSTVSSAKKESLHRAGFHGNHLLPVLTSSKVRASRPAFSHYVKIQFPSHVEEFHFLSVSRENKLFSLCFYLIRFIWVGLALIKLVIYSKRFIFKSILEKIIYVAKVLFLFGLVGFFWFAKELATRFP